MDDGMSTLAAALAGRYTIEGRAGQGGMATVYRATDLKHHRAVAIKVLRPELAATIGSDRFLREIEVSARLQHPHIVPLFDSGLFADAPGGMTSGRGDPMGRPYYVMPFLEGESLRDRLARDGVIPFDEAVTLTREVASALGYAHAHGIVHRDIKPENVMLSGGHAVVADFGIARALDAAAQGDGVTGLGIAVGTPAYMSPEQATGSEVDARTDQYSLACLFYEMVTGRTPFSGPTVQAVITQSLTGPRPKLSRVFRAAPPDVDAAVVRALAADPPARFPSVAAFADALQQAAGGGAGAVAERRRLRRLVVALPLAVAIAAAAWIAFGPSRAGPVVAGAESIAVMPFSVSGAGVEEMGEGMVDLLSTNLNAVGGIRAIEPRTVMARIKQEGLGAGLDLDRALGVARGVKAQAALLGSIVATGPRVRMSADLYGEDGKRLAHAQVDGATDSVLALVDALSLALVREIWRSKEPVPSLRVSGLTTGSLAAMREYLVGEQYYRRSQWDSATSAFGRAIEQDSTFALAHYRLAAAIGWSGGLGAAGGREASDAALRFAGRLPPRERTIVTAYNLFTHGALAATDSMRAYVARYPEDVDGWNLLGESQFHSRQLVGYDPATLRAPFDSVLARDSTLTPAAIHPLEIAMSSGDSVRFPAYLKVLQRGGNDVESRAYEGGGRLMFHRGPIDSLTARAMLRYQGSMSGMFSDLYAAGATTDTVLARLEAWGDMMRMNPEAELQFQFGRAIALASVGRFGDAYALGDSLRRASPNNGWIVLWPGLMGFAPAGHAESEARQLLATPRASPWIASNAAALFLARGEADPARRLVDSVLGTDLTRFYPPLVELLRVQRGWALVLQGDTVNGIRQAREALPGTAGLATWMTAPIRLQLAGLLASRTATRAEGIRLLRYGFDSDFGTEPMVQFALGQAFEAAGDRPAAAEAYGRFLRFWDKADSSAQPRVQAAKDGLRRVTGEPK